MPVNRILLVILVVFLSTVNGLSQNNFKPGYIIANNFDTVRGFINYESKLIKSKECIFKKTQESEKEAYTADMIKGYRIDESEYFVSQKINGENIFVEFMVDGIVDLYQLKTNDGDIYYLKKDTTIYQLASRLETVYVDGKPYEKETNRYKGYLRLAFGDDPKIQDNITKSFFDKKSLISLTKQYHADVCTEYECIEFTSPDKTVVYAGLKVTYGSSMLKLDDSNQKPKSNGVTAGFLIEIFPEFLPRSISLLTGLDFGSFSFKEDFKIKGYYDGRLYRVNMSAEYVRIPFTVQYYFPSKRVQPMVSVGLNTLFLQSFRHSVVIVRDGDQFPMESTLHDTYFGLTGGAGVNIEINPRNRIIVKADYENRKLAKQLGGTLLTSHTTSTFMFSIVYAAKITK